MNVNYEVEGLKAFLSDWAQPQGASKIRQTGHSISKGYRYAV